MSKKSVPDSSLSDSPDSQRFLHTFAGCSFDKKQKQSRAELGKAIQRARASSISSERASESLRPQHRQTDAAGTNRLECPAPSKRRHRRHRKRLGTSHLSSLIFNVAKRMVTRTAYTTVNQSVFSRVPESPSAPFHTYSMKRESGFKSNEVPMAAERADRKRTRRKD